LELGSCRAAEAEKRQRELARLMLKRRNVYSHSNHRMHHSNITVLKCAPVWSMNSFVWADLLSDFFIANSWNK
jgi:hypothetical protein